MPVNVMSGNMFIHLGAETTDIVGASITSASMDMSVYDNAIFILEVGTWAVANDLVMQVLQDTVANMATPIALVPDKALTITGASVVDGQTYAFEVKAAELTVGQRYVALKATCAGAATVQNVTIVKAGFNSRKRYTNLPAYTVVTP